MTKERVIEMMEDDLKEQELLDTTDKEEFYEGWHKATEFWLELLKGKEND